VAVPNLDRLNVIDSSPGVGFVRLLFALGWRASRSHGTGAPALQR